MGMTEKQSLVNEIAIKFAEDYGLSLKETKAKLSEITQFYHVQIADESGIGANQSTEYLMKKFIEGKRAANMSENTIKQYIIAVEKIESCTGKQLSDLEVDDIYYFLRTYGATVSSVTLRAKYQLLSSVFNYLFLHKLIAYNPIAYTETPKAEIKYKTPITDFDIEKVKFACEHLPEKEGLRDMALIHFMMTTGCRVSEVCNICMKDIDFDKKICIVMGKGKKERPVVLTDRVIYRIKLYLDTRKDTSDYAPLFAHIRGEENKMTKDGVGVLVQKLKKLAGIETITCHSFRRYFATELRKRGVGVQIIASSLGHANLNQVMRYSLLNKGETMAEVRKVL